MTTDKMMVIISKGSRALGSWLPLEGWNYLTDILGSCMDP